jgi:3-methyladenine DNA glycosylase AlkD
MQMPAYIQPLEAEFIKHADPENAIPMSRYMKNRFDFFGINSPLRKDIFSRHKQKYGLIPEGEEKEIVTWCWEAPQREYQYFAMDFLARKKNKADKKIIGLYEYMITHKSWWDTVDLIASHLVGAYFKRFPESIPEITGRWMNSGNMWLQRTCLLFQLKYKEDTDTKLLSSFIGKLAFSEEFFIRKAIGWALREYSKTNPDFVIGFVRDNKTSGLSEREALKWLKNKGERK